MSVQHWLGFWLEMMASRASSGSFCPSSMNSAHWSRHQMSAAVLPDASRWASVLTEYRFALFSFGASLYWTMAFKCGSWSSTCRRKHQQSEPAQAGRFQTFLRGHGGRVDGRRAAASLPAVPLMTSGALI